MVVNNCSKGHRIKSPYSMNALLILLSLFMITNCFAGEFPGYIALKGADGGTLIGKHLKQNDHSYMSALVGDMNVRISSSIYVPGTPYKVKNIAVSLSYIKDDPYGYIVPGNFPLIESRFPDLELNIQQTNNMNCLAPNIRVVIDDLHMQGNPGSGGLCYYYTDENGLGWPVDNFESANSFILTVDGFTVDGNFVYLGMVGEILRGDIFMLSD